MDGGGAPIRAASIVTEQHKKTKVFNFEEEAHLSDLRQKVSPSRGRQINRGEQRVNLHQVEKDIASMSPIGNKQLARLHSAKNLVRRVADQNQALMAHDQDQAFVGEAVSSFHPDEFKQISSRLDTDNETNSHLRLSSQNLEQREAPELANSVPVRRTKLMESAQQHHLVGQALGTSAQRSANPNANGVAEKISPQKVVNTSLLGRLQKSPAVSQSKTQHKKEKWFTMQSGRQSGSSSSKRASSCEESDPGVIQLPNLNRRKSKMSATMSAFLEDASQQILDSSLNQSFNLSQANYQYTSDRQQNQLLYEASQRQIRENSVDFWKSATSQTSAPIAKLQSEKQSAAKEKLNKGLAKVDRQQTMTTKKTKPIQMLNSSSQKEHLDCKAELHEPIVEKNDQKLTVHHRTQQSMDNSTVPFKTKNPVGKRSEVETPNDKVNAKNQRGAKTRLEKKLNSVSTTLQPEENKSYLTERQIVKAAAGSSTTSAATQKNRLPKDLSSGQQTHNERSRLNCNHNLPNVSNQTNSKGSSGSRRSQSSQNERRSSGKKKHRRKHTMPSNTDLSSAQHQTPKGAYFSISRQLAPSNSSLPPSSLADDQCSQEEEYQSIWAAVSKSIDQTNESNYMAQRDGDISYIDQETEHSGYHHFFNQSLCPSNLGQLDQNSSFHGSQSQASQYGQDLDSSFYESATNSNWAKSDRNSFALKSQHSQSTYNKQTTQQQQQQVASHQVAGYARRPSAIEETKTGQTSANQAPGIYQASQTSQHTTQAAGQSHVNQDGQISPVSSSASSAQKKYLSSQKGHHYGKGPSQHISSSNPQPVQNQQDMPHVNKSQLQTPSKEHHRQHKLQLSSSTATMSLQQQVSAGAQVSNNELTPSSGNVRHSSFTQKQLSGYINTSGNLRGQPLIEDCKMMPQDSQQAQRGQISQSVQPTSNRNTVSSHQITTFTQQSIHGQAVPHVGHQVAASMSASRQNQSQQLQAFDFATSPLAQSSDANHMPFSVSSFTEVPASSTPGPFTHSDHHQSVSLGTKQFTPTIIPQQLQYQQNSPSLLQQNLEQSTMTRFTPYTLGQTHSVQNLFPQQSAGSSTAQQPQFYPKAQSISQQHSLQSPASPQVYHQNSNKVPQFANQTDQGQQNFGFSSPAQFQVTPQQMPAGPTQWFGQGPTYAQLDQQLEEIKRFHQVEGVPCSQLELQSYLEQVKMIQDPNQRNMAQQNLIFHLQQLLKSKQQNLMMAASQRQHFQGASVGFDHRRDYSSSSSASKISSSSHHSSVSSQQRSSHQNNLKIALAQAFRDLDSLQSSEEKVKFLVTKAHLFAKDKAGFQLLKNKIDEEEFQLQQQEQMDNCSGNNHNMKGKPQSKFVEDLFKQLISSEYTAFHKLMMHQVANFFCQELFRLATGKQLESVLEVIKNDFHKIAADMHGTRALQILLESQLIHNDKRTDRMPVLLYEALKSGRIFELSCNIRGSHVIRQCLTLLRTDEKRSIIYEPIIQHFTQVARDKHGCQVVKECITTAQGHWKKDLIRVSFESVEHLINDEFGNFVIQAILEHFISMSKRKSKVMDVRVSCFYEFIRLNLGKLCKQQYSSRVVEKAVETMPKEQFEKVCVVFMKNSSKKSKMFKEIMLDSYGNYIAPKIMEMVKVFALQQQFDYFSKIYRESIEALKKVKHGRQLMVKMNQILQLPQGIGKQTKQGSQQTSSNNGSSSNQQQQSSSCQQSKDTSQQSQKQAAKSMPNNQNQ